MDILKVNCHDNPRQGLTLLFLGTQKSRIPYFILPPGQQNGTTFQNTGTVTKIRIIIIRNLSVNIANLYLFHSHMTLITCTEFSLREQNRAP
jgi:hypothetical protein